MAQVLIVEGNDAIALSVILAKFGLSPPLGYEEESKFRHEFVKNAKGYQGVLKTIEQVLDDSNISNIGIVVDADDAGAQNRWLEIRRRLETKFDAAALDAADQMSGYKIVTEKNMPKVGVWIMPDNAGNGYLEHFLAQFIPENDRVWPYVLQTIDHLQQQDFNRITPAKTGKAQLHTWLAWQEEPGKPFGQAVSANYFSIDADSAKTLADWFRATFELSALPR